MDVSWTIKKAEYWRIKAFELWCWIRLLRVPWTARRSNQSILKEINPKYLLEGQMLKLKLQYFGHRIWRAHWQVVPSCPNLCDPMDCSLPGSSVHGIFQARVLEWVAISFSRGSSWPRDRTRISHIVGRCFTVWVMREELTHWKRPWCWERWRAGGERDNRGWDGWMASPTQWTRVWANSGR